MQLLYYANHSPTENSLFASCFEFSPPVVCLVWYNHKNAGLEASVRLYLELYLLALHRHYKSLNPTSCSGTTPLPIRLVETLPLQLVIHKAIQVSHSSATYTGRQSYKTCFWHKLFGYNFCEEDLMYSLFAAFACLLLKWTSIVGCSYQCNYETQPKQCYKLCMEGALWWILYYTYLQCTCIFEPLIYILSAKTLLTDSTINTR